ncbi:MAG: hypothetical protein AAF213_10785 [Pseudomonadota bacterium]
MTTILPSGPQRDNRSSLSPGEYLVEFAKRHPRTTAGLVGLFAGGVGAVPAVALTQGALWVSRDFRVMKQTARAHKFDRLANQRRDGGNLAGARTADEKASKIRRKIAGM